MDKLGLIAGGGDLPGQIAAACQEKDRPIFAIALKGYADPKNLAGVPHVWVSLGRPGQALRTLRREGCRDVVMVGRVRRPTPWELWADWTAIRFFTRLGRYSLGDDGLLRNIVRAIEDEGFRVLSVHEIVKDLRAPTGIWGHYAPSTVDWKDIRRGQEVAQALGCVDVGQAVVVQSGLVLGVEAIEGTDALLQRCGQLQRTDRGGVLVKTAKPGQEMRADLPTVGPETVRQAAAAGLCGIAVQAEKTLVAGYEETVAAADWAGVFVLGMQVEA